MDFIFLTLGMVGFIVLVQGLKATDADAPPEGGALKRLLPIVVVTAALVAVNHARCQILAPHHEVDPWAGLAMGATDAGTPTSPTAPTTGEPTGW